MLFGLKFLILYNGVEHATGCFGASIFAKHIASKSNSGCMKARPMHLIPAFRLYGIAIGVGNGANLIGSHFRSRSSHQPRQPLAQPPL
jgi:hypothetical protein